MVIINTPRYSTHRPEYEFFEGEMIPHAEKVSRVEVIEQALEKAHFSIQPVSKTVPLPLLGAIHEPRYIRFLEDFCNTLAEKKIAYPSVFPKKISDQLTNPQALFGFFSLDTYTPLLYSTYQVALDSASAAYEAATMIQSGQEKVVYALCRPPGHHAEQSQMGGYCYFNNAAVAAQYLSNFGKVVVLDLDFHHGNGTQNIFYNRSDVYYISLHADPNWKFPHLSGFPDERGDGEGNGYNQNFPLGIGTDNHDYTRILKRALQITKKYQPKFLVISLGLDTHQDDPISGFNLTTDYYHLIGQLIQKLQIPTVVVQEGGYNTDVLGEAVVQFLRGFNE